MDYALLKAVHVMSVGLSLGGFLLRGVGVAAGAAWARGRLARTLPHINDTVLLLSAVALAWTLRFHPLEQPWLAAKLLALPLYIALGAIALRSTSRRRTVLALVAAVAVFAYIVMVATSKSPFPLGAALP